MATRGTSIASVDIGVQNAVKRHGRRTRAHHCDHDPHEADRQVGDLEVCIAPGQQRSCQRKRKSKDRVLELDHIER